MKLFNYKRRAIYRESRRRQGVVDTSFTNTGITTWSSHTSNATQAVRSQCYFLGSSGRQCSRSPTGRRWNETGRIWSTGHTDCWWCSTAGARRAARAVGNSRLSSLRRCRRPRSRDSAAAGEWRVRVPAWARPVSTCRRSGDRRRWWTASAVLPVTCTHRITPMSSSVWYPRQHYSPPIERPYSMHRI